MRSVPASVRAFRARKDGASLANAAAAGVRLSIRDAVTPLADLGRPCGRISSVARTARELRLQWRRLVSPIGTSAAIQARDAMPLVPSVWTVARTG